MEIIRKNSPRRVGLLDEVRGFAIICMVVYHAFYNLVFMFGFDIPIFTSTGMNSVRDLFAGIFIFISGSVCHYSKSNLKRGALCFACGMLLTAVTYFVIPSQIIKFGILHLLGICMMLYPFLQKPLGRIPDAAGIILLILAFFITYNLPRGYLGIEPHFSLLLPSGLYGANIFPLGFINSTFYSSDFFPILPWCFIFFAGFYFVRRLKSGKMPAFFYSTHCPPLAAVGRNTLIIYLLHQPIIYGILELISFLTR